MKKLVPLLLALLLLVAACGTGGKQSSDKSNGKTKSSNDEFNFI